MDSLILQYGSAIFGGLAILSVCLVFVRKHTFGFPGFGLLVAGTVLIGLPVWSSAKFAWDKEGVQFEFQMIVQQLSNLENQMQQSQFDDSEVRVALSQISESIEKVQATSNVSLATFSSSPQFSKSDSPLANAYWQLATGSNSGAWVDGIPDDSALIRILKNTEALKSIKHCI